MLQRISKYVEVLEHFSGNNILQGIPQYFPEPGVVAASAHVYDLRCQSCSQKKPEVKPDSAWLFGAAQREIVCMAVHLERHRSLEDVS